MRREKTVYRRNSIRLDWIHTSADDCRLSLDNLVEAAKSSPALLEAGLRDIEATIEATIEEYERLSGHRTRLMHLRSATRKLHTIFADQQRAATPKERA